MKLAFVFLALSAAPLFAQDQPIIPDACLNSIPAAAFRRVTVFLEPTADAASKDILPGADFFAQSVGFKMRELLGGSSSNLPQGDSAVDWSRAWGEVEVTAHRGAPATWRVPDWTSGAGASARSAVGLVERAIAEVVAAGENVLVPDGVPEDSAVFSLSLGHAVVKKDGKLVPLKSRQPVAVFTLMVPWSANPELLEFPKIDYGDLSGSKRSTGSVTLSFLIDKSGRIDTESVREIWPHGAKRPTGTVGSAYDAFVRAAKRDLRTGKYKPAIIGGCTVAQYVVQQFNFDIP
jgi:hypothetical protein